MNALDFPHSVVDINAVLDEDPNERLYEMTDEQFERHLANLHKRKQEQ